MLGLLKNPFFIYPISFTIVFLLYGLGWSNIFPSLEINTILFFILSFLVYFFIGHIVTAKNYLGYKNIDKINGARRHIIFIAIGYALEFFVSKEIPLISMISGHSYVSYNDFGIKSFHVFLVTYNSYISVFLFHHFISRKRKVHLFYFIASLIPAILIVNRGMLLIALFSSLFVFIQAKGSNIKVKQVLIIAIFCIFVLYFFGLWGNIRSANGDSDYVPKHSEVTHSFMNSKIPKEYYWTYLYGASPLANFQHNINEQKEIKYNLFDFALFEITPEIFSKRLATLFGREKRDPYLIKEWLTVGTVFSKSYSYIKWFGPIILIIYLAFFIVVIIGLVPKRSNYHVSTIAVLCTLVFLNTFSNMLVFSGIILQLVFPVIFVMLEGKKIIIKQYAK